MKYVLTFFSFASLLPSDALALGSISCSDARGELIYTYNSANRGYPPRPGDWRETHKWEFRKNVVHTRTGLFEKPDQVMGAKVTSTFHERTRKVLSTPVKGSGMGSGSERVSVLKVSVHAPDVPEMTGKRFMLCHDVTPPPAP